MNTARLATVEQTSTQTSTSERPPLGLVAEMFT